MIKIEFHTSDIYLQDLARRYWERNREGAWKETVESLSISLGIPRHQIPRIVKEASTAYLETMVCSICKKPAPLASRTDFTHFKTPRNFLPQNGISDVGDELNYICKVCDSIKRNAELQLQRERGKKRVDLINLALDKISQRSFNYSTISFLDAVYCYVVHQASGIGSYSNKEAILPSQTFIAYTLDAKTKIFNQLFDRGILQISKESPLSAFDVGERGVTYEPSKVVWTFALDSKNLSDVMISRIINMTLKNPDCKSLCALWEIVAQYECEAYFYEVCERWGHSSWRFTKDKQEAIIYALKNYSIPRVWNMMFQEAKNLGAQVNAGAYNRRHIENMYSGNLRRRADKCFANSWDVRPWKRRTFDKECHLTSVVFDYLFGGGDRDWEEISSASLERRAVEVVELFSKK